MNKVITTAVVAMIALTLIASSNGSVDEQQGEQDMYCEMVQLGLKTSNEFGWPDYKGIYNEVCK